MSLVHISDNTNDSWIAQSSLS